MTTKRLVPTIPLLDKRFQYVDSAHTCLRTRFATIRAEQAKARTVADADTQKVVDIFAERRAEADDARR